MWEGGSNTPICEYLFILLPTLLVTVGSLRATDIRWPRSVLVLRRRRRTLVALVNSWSTGELKKLLADGRLLSSDTTIWKEQQQGRRKMKKRRIITSIHVQLQLQYSNILLIHGYNYITMYSTTQYNTLTSPPSRGTTLEKCVTQMTSSSSVMGLRVSCPKYCSQSLYENRAI